MALVTNIPITSATVEPLSRHEMLLWVNECLQAEYGKLEQLHTGAGYCLFTDKFTNFKILFPGTIQMKKVKFNSLMELDWLSNWKIVQTSWKQLGIEKVIPVEKLIKGKFQDNFEFLQWFKKFFDANYDGHCYDPAEMRNYEELPKEGKLKANSGASSRMPQRSQPPPKPARLVVKPAATPQRAGSDASVNSGGSTGGYAKSASKKTVTGSTKARPAPAMTNSAGRTNNIRPSAQQTQQRQPPQQVVVQPDIHLIEELKHKNAEAEELRNQLAESDDVISGLERERDFYFAKLRKIEVLCQDNEAAGSLDVNGVLQILYETEEGFAPPDEGTNGGGADEVNKNGNNGAI